MMLGLPLLQLEPLPLRLESQPPWLGALLLRSGPLLPRPAQPQQPAQWPGQPPPVPRSASPLPRLLR